MSREAFGDPPDREPEYCPNCGSDFYMPGCSHCEEVKRRCEAESDLLRMRIALTRLWPALERAMSGLVFTADRAGEVQADMNTLRAHIKTPNGADERRAEGESVRSAGYPSPLK